MVRTVTGPGALLGRLNRTFVVNKKNAPSEHGQKLLENTVEETRTGVATVATSGLFEELLRNAGLTAEEYAFIVERLIQKYITRRLPDVQDVVSWASHVALERFDRTRCQGKSGESRIAFKVDRAVRNHAAMHSVEKVCDAYAAFTKRHGFEPSILELRKVAKIRPRVVVNVLDSLRKTFDLDPSCSRLLGSAQELVVGDVVSHPGHESTCATLVKQVLAQMPASDACLVLLQNAHDYSEQEILDLLKRARATLQQSPGVDSLEEFIERSTGYDAEIPLPCDPNISSILNRSTLAAALFHARKRYFSLLRNCTQPNVLGVPPDGRRFCRRIMLLVSPKRSRERRTPSFAVIRQVLSRMRPTEACLLILLGACQFSSKRLLKLVRRARREYQRKRSVDAVDAVLDDATLAGAAGIEAPWDFDLLKIKSVRAIDSRLTKACRSFRILLKPVESNF